MGYKEKRKVALRKSLKKQKSYLKGQVREENKHAFDRKLEYADKPVNGTPGDDRIDILRSLCSERGLKLCCIGMTAKETEEIIKYFRGMTDKKPRCYNKYITKTEG